MIKVSLNFNLENELSLQVGFFQLLLIDDFHGHEKAYILLPDQKYIPKPSLSKLFTDLKIIERYAFNVIPHRFIKMIPQIPGSFAFVQGLYTRPFQ